MSNLTMPPQQPAFVPQPVFPVAPVRKNGLGTTSLVTGILAGGFAFIPVVGAFFAIPLAIIAIFFGVFGLVRALRGRAAMGLPIAGGVLGIVAMIISISFSVAAANAIDDAISDTGAVGTDTTSTDTTSTTTGGTDTAGTKTTKHHKAAAPVKAGIGDTVTDGQLAFTVTRVRTGVTQIGDQYFGEKADGAYTIVSVTVKNVGHDSALFDDSSQYVYSAKGDKYSAASDADIVLDDSNSFLNEINPGNTVKGKMAFDMPKGTSAASVEVHGGMFSAGATIDLN